MKYLRDKADRMELREEEVLVAIHDYKKILAGFISEMEPHEKDKYSFFS